MSGKPARTIRNAEHTDSLGILTGWQDSVNSRVRRTCVTGAAGTPRLTPCERRDAAADCCGDRHRSRHGAALLLHTRRRRRACEQPPSSSSGGHDPGRRRPDRARRSHHGRPRHVRRDGDGRDPERDDPRCGSQRHDHRRPGQPPLRGGGHRRRRTRPEPDGTQPSLLRCPDHRPARRERATGPQ